MGALTLTELAPALIILRCQHRQMLVTSPQSQRQCGPVTDHPGLWCSLRLYGGVGV